MIRAMIFDLDGTLVKTERLKAIFERVLSEGYEVHLKNLDEIEPESLSSYDLVYLGSACHDADLAEPVQIFLDSITTAPPFKLAGFVTHAAAVPKASDREQELFQKWAGRCADTFEESSKKKDVDFLGYFHCQGAPSPPIETFIHKEIILDQDEWENYIKEGNIRTKMILQRLWISLVIFSRSLRNTHLTEFIRCNYLF
jgi:phosphoglycolate phosphatase-like HAD superfamily hydrolase